MPLYDFQCPTDGNRFEVLFKRIPKGKVNARKCPQCGARSPLVPSLPVMKPDSLWAGRVDPNYGYHTSATSLKQEMKRRNHVTCGDRTDLEGMDKVAEQAQHAKEEKSKKRIRGVMERAFGPGGLGLGGADGAKLVKETLEKGG